MEIDLLTSNLSASGSNTSINDKAVSSNVIGIGVQSQELDHGTNIFRLAQSLEGNGFPGLFQNGRIDLGGL